MAAFAEQAVSTRTAPMTTFNTFFIRILSLCPAEQVTAFKYLQE